ncbi:hypothetical protein SALBM311S_11466 [Streptomyces alboniger]
MTAVRAKPDPRQPIEVGRAASSERRASPVLVGEGCGTEVLQPFGGAVRGRQVAGSVDQQVEALTSVSVGGAVALQDLLALDDLARQCGLSAALETARFSHASIDSCSRTNRSDLGRSGRSRASTASAV